MTFFNRYLSKEQAKLNFETTLLMLTNELSTVKTMSHCSDATSFEVGIENVKVYQITFLSPTHQVALATRQQRNRVVFELSCHVLSTTHCGVFTVSLFIAER